MERTAGSRSSVLRSAACSQRHARAELERSGGALPADELRGTAREGKRSVRVLPGESSDYAREAEGGVWRLRFRLDVRVSRVRVNIMFNMF